MNIQKTKIMSPEDTSICKDNNQLEIVQCTYTEDSKYNSEKELNIPKQNEEGAYAEQLSEIYERTLKD